MDKRNILVTGAARGIGYAIAEIFAKSGENLYIVDKDENLLSAAVTKLQSAGSGNVKSFVVNLRDSTAIKSMFEDLENISLNVVVNCAGISTSALMKDVELESWDLVMDVNAKAVFLISQLASKQMINNKIKDGRIINISSQASKIAEKANGVYCISKAAVNMITQVMGLELAEYGITVNSICPGYVRTELLVQVFNERGPLEGMTPDEYEKVLTDKVPLGRLATPEDIAKYTYFLAGEDASYVTGISHTVAGGVTLI